MSNTPNLQTATDFIWKNARLLDRLRFAFLFQDGPKEPILSALAAYQNSDGGFGNTLEPDLRGPTSQPVPVWSAFGILDELDDFTVPMVGKALDYLSSITTDTGGVPFVLPSVKDYPHAPWWETDENPPAVLNPTAGLVAFLHKGQVHHPWVEKASEFCWQRIEGLTETSPYELATILQFLDSSPEKQRAKQAFQHVKILVEKQQFITLDPDTAGEVHFPLEFAPTPDSIGRQLFSDEVINQHLDAVIRKQRPDGGWMVNFPIWTPITEYEWRGAYTIECLKTLKAYGRLRLG